jgi:hypothetical protein
MQAPIRIKLTQLAVDRLKEPGTYWDVQFPGFGIRVNPGGRKTYIAMYRVAGKAKMESLGTSITILNVADARDLARQSMIKAAKGTDPVKEKKEERAKAEAEKVAKEFTSASWPSSSLPTTPHGTRRHQPPTRPNVCSIE